MSMLEVAPSAALATEVPASAAMPRGPVLSAASFRRRGYPAVPSVLDAGPRRLVTSGRVAIAQALRLMGVGPGDKVLVPAYHCASMIEPVEWIGATPVFYRIDATTRVDLDDVAAKCDGATKVLLAANYFGFPQQLDRLREFCDTHGLRLLEDCAHAFLGQYQGRPLGSWGDYAIASSMKFFPLYEGGALVSARHPLGGVQLHSGGWRFNAKVAINVLEKSFAHGRLGGLHALLALPLALKNQLWHRIKRQRPASASAAGPDSSDGGFSFDPGWLDKRSALVSRLLLRTVSRPRMGALRQRHYLYLQQALQGLPGCRPLHPSLPEHVYPWGFPLLVEAPERLFAHLKQRGVPALRFAQYLVRGVDASVCPTSAHYSQHVLLLPCHQELRQEELELVVRSVREVLAP